MKQWSSVLVAFIDSARQQPVLVRAHTDCRGPADRNLGLSARRAESVINYLTEKGVGELQIETAGMGESLLIETNDAPEYFLTSALRQAAVNPIGPHAGCVDNSSCSAAGSCLPTNIRQ